MNERYVMSLFEEKENKSEEIDPLGYLGNERKYSLLNKGRGISKNRINTTKINFDRLHFIKQFYPNATIEDWQNWRWQIRNSIICFDQLKNFLNFSDEEYQALLTHKDRLPLRITPYYASLIDRDNPSQAIRRCVVPTINEFIINEGEAEDPLSEENQSPVEGIVHRYPDRVLFLSTGFCSSNCRYCTRSRMVGQPGQSYFNKEKWDIAIEYIKSHKEIRDVLISGGDPLTLLDEHIEYLLYNLYKISHIEIIRIGTKVPVVLPMRITKELVKVLKKYHPLWMNIHFTHPDEITPEVSNACAMLADAGIPLGSQTVLLKGINDDVETMKKLVHLLVKNRVRPYYIYQCDPIIGSKHFRTSIEKGLEIIKGLRGHTTGFAVPTYVIDAPGGGGKIPLLPQYYIGKENNNIILKNYEDKIFIYPEQ
ncbi:MAG TPA: KamA family radical SAM protein [bacterium]|nr:KamA family radical SAM protein [bacterium]HOL46760.1 KamA family radical SAM protein [bacterium]HPQ18196.1 KamA family radical SAM protein [bacterium]